MTPHFRSAGAVLALALAGCGGSGTSPLSPSEPMAAVVAPARVVILSVDGLRPDVLNPAIAPNIMAMAQRGAFSWSAQTVTPSETLPAHSSMLSGELPSVHGMTWDDNAPAGAVIPVPTIFSVAHAAGRRTAMVASKSKFLHLNRPGSLDSVQIDGRGDASVATEAIARLHEGTDLLFVHFADVDLAGHARGWMSDPYVAAVTEADRAVGRILAAVSAQTTVILTADHGGRGRNHGDSARENTTIPWVIVGPGIAPHGISRPIRTVDTAATALHVLGLQLSGTSGAVVSEAFARGGASSASAERLDPEVVRLRKHAALASRDHAPKSRNR